MLPPSETKSDGGRGAPLDLAALALPELTPVRHALVTALSGLDPDTARKVLALGPSQDGELARNAALHSSRTTPALRRYTGVLYDALGVAGFTRTQHAKAHARIMIGSALFGAVSAGDLIPAYRLSAGTRLPGLATLASQWRPLLGTALQRHGPILDLRSGAYQQLGPVPGAITASVLTEHPDGSRTVVSHFSKHHKGLLARALITSRAEPDTVTAIVRIARRAGLRAEATAEHELTLLTD